MLMRAMLLEISPAVSAAAVAADGAAGGDADDASLEYDSASPS